jgi:hypothetical protein
VSRLQWTCAVLASTSLGLLVASAMSFLDWRLNPGGIFHSETGTNWHVVWETWLSWFIPVFFLVGAVTLPVLFWRSRRGS